MTDWGLFANSVMRGRVHARRTLKGLVAYLRMTIFSLSQEHFMAYERVSVLFLGNKPVLFRDYFPPPRAAKQYAPPSNPRLDGQRIYTSMQKYPSFIHRPA